MPKQRFNPYDYKTLEEIITVMTPRMADFVVFYDGNATAAARKAGYTGSDLVIQGTGCRLLKNPKVARALALRAKAEAPNKNVASRAERQVMWSNLMKNEDEAASVRLKASELLGKSEGDFVDRLKMEEDHTVNITINVIKPGVAPLPDKPGHNDPIDVTPEE